MLKKSNHEFCIFLRFTVSKLVIIIVAFLFDYRLHCLGSLNNVSNLNSLADNFMSFFICHTLRSVAALKFSEGLPCHNFVSFHPGEFGSSLDCGCQRIVGICKFNIFVKCYIKHNYQFSIYLNFIISSRQYPSGESENFVSTVLILFMYLLFYFANLFIILGQRNVSFTLHNSEI